MSSVELQPQAAQRHVKVQASHLVKLALVYVRQSSPHQVLHHRESRELQYALVNRALELGWPRDRILVIDDDQATSGRWADGRSGFQTMLAEVSCSHVGVILGTEMSRMARSGKDWHQLLEACGIFESLLADLDGVYDLRDANDRLLLGLKGTISEAELHTMRNRLWLGRLNKARRGELFQRVASGYVVTSAGELTKDPDEQVRFAIETIFEKFQELKTCAAVLRYLLEHQIRLGVRRYGGAAAGELQWRTPCYSSVQFILHNPIYAGAYAFGRTATDPRRRGKSGQGRRALPRAEWTVLLQDQLPAYVSWEQYLANQQQMAGNLSRPSTPGAPREGSALLAGVARCGRCGRRLRVMYGKRSAARYACTTDQTHHAATICQSLAAGPVDALIGQLALTAIAPASLELSLHAAADSERERKKLDRHWQQQLERAEYDAELARRQFAAVDPDNRLVARELERTWEQQLRAKQDLEEQHRRQLSNRPVELTDEEKDCIRALARDLPGLWHSPETSHSDRRAVIRQIIDAVVIQTEGNAERVSVTVRWRGGYESRHELLRPVGVYEQLSGYTQLDRRVAELQAEGASCQRIADELNREGFKTARLKPFTRNSVYKFLARKRPPRRRNHVDAKHAPRDNEWWPADLSKKLNVPIATLGFWRRKGWLGARKLPEMAGRWIYWADKCELERLSALRRHPRRSIGYPNELATPLCPKQYLQVPPETPAAD